MRKLSPKVDGDPAERVSFSWLQVSKHRTELTHPGSYRKVNVLSTIFLPYRFLILFHQCSILVVNGVC